MADYVSECEVLKVDESLGLVFGWGIVCSKGGKPYSDTDAERIEPAEMLKAAAEFTADAERPTDEMHNEIQDGQVVFSMPITNEIAKVFGITFDDDPDQVTEGWMVAVKPSRDVLRKFADGTYTGFSIGGVVEEFEADEAVA